MKELGHALTGLLCVSDKSHLFIFVISFSDIHPNFIQRVSKACYAERSIFYDRFHLSVCPSQSGVMSKGRKL